ncbi:MAG: hypothetical protein HW416_935 [Chloroflexi bacterium]|nr:hypothetical protein [Chloroflexota bacterium]
MANYVVLGNFTAEGIKGIKNGPAMRQGAEQAITSRGGRIIWQGLTLGQYDFVAVVDMPGDEQLLEVAFLQGMSGMVRTQTLKAFTVEQVDAVAARLP